MFFIGIFGIENRQKEIKTLTNLCCKNCNCINGAKLIKSFACFHFFFIPIFKWNENYYVICNDCNYTYSISKEKGKAIEKGENIEITYWDLEEVHISSYDGHYNIKRCTRCNKELENNYEFCPYCGEKIK